MERDQRTTTTASSVFFNPLKMETSMKVDEQEETTTNNRQFELIDLVSPANSPDVSEPRHRSYIPRTLDMNNHRRVSILPMFPTTFDNSNDHLLLLANVAEEQLSMEDRRHRRIGQHQCSFHIVECRNPDDSFMLQQYQTYFGSLLNRLHVDIAILDYNYSRMRSMIRRFSDARQRTINSRTFDLPTEDRKLSEQEHPSMLEFYLQMDVDLFYMKTCNFREARPRSLDEGIFCREPPICLYAMTACGSCSLCSRSYELTGRQQSPVKFNQYQVHRFVNGYESILNAPATCITTNFIYVLTCPCGEYDFIGETTQTLEKRLIRHRDLGNRIMHAFLTGELNRQRSTGSACMNNETRIKSRMRLYQHSTQCPRALQMFLDYNQQYWCFVPMKNDEANRYDLHYRATTNVSTLKHRDANVEQRLSYVPRPPTGYRFTDEQKLKQYDFLQTLTDKYSPKLNLDLYDAEIVCLLPPFATDLFRQIIHSMFVTHSDSKLNTLGQIFDDVPSVPIARHNWCEGLAGRPTERSTATRIRFQ